MVGTTRNTIAAIGLVSASVLGWGWAIAAQAESTPEQAALMQQASELRSQGATGLKTFLHRHATELRPGQVPATALREALDSLCQQKDCYTSQLYWYTDLEAAKAAAQATGKPILSLRLLGRLDQDLSCANSRFFRVALYPNTQISQRLRDRFILHWESVRPVPKVTVDFGDGRVMERTITGNSIHYILAPDGRPIEALPGLYGPQAFLQQLEQAEQAVQQYQQQAPADRNQFLQRYHRDRLVQLQTQWSAELAQLGITTPPQLTDQTVTTGQPPSAALAGQIAMTKAMIESPLVTSLVRDVSQTQRALTDITDKAAWEKLAALNAEQARLDSASIALLRTKKLGTAIPASADHRSLTPVIQKFEAAMALDTVRNEYLLHSQLHQWFIRGTMTQNVDRLNDQVYSSLFLTPKDDPWLGLVSQDEFSGIEQDGMRQ
ncbi:hypothetical protein ACN4EK_28515 [Pantanalinema rosaneae CENA516]|uniref:hypothetical protein n=1 Tax=Pantanalinema rosaneae TaxID=1620701 RepID=UPI003D6DF0AC